MWMVDALKLEREKQLQLDFPLAPSYYKHSSTSYLPALQIAALVTRMLVNNVYVGHSVRPHVTDSFLEPNDFQGTTNSDT
jgi:hypothetical protein